MHDTFFGKIQYVNERFFSKKNPTPSGYFTPCPLNGQGKIDKLFLDTTQRHAAPSVVVPARIHRTTVKVQVARKSA